jgi:hypothetical protein
MKRFLIVLAGLWSLCINGYAADGKSQIMINIDNPAFRKMVVAIPKIQVAGQLQSPQGKKLAEEGSQELIRLLQFSGFFSALAESAYSGAWDQFAKARKTTESTAWITDSKGLSGEEVVQWRALGVESLTMGALTEDPAKGLTLSFKTFDVTRSRKFSPSSSLTSRITRLRFASMLTSSWKPIRANRASSIPRSPS